MVEIFNGFAILINLIPFIFYIFCFYFTLTFFQHLKSGQEHLQKRSKILAVVSLAIALLAPMIIWFL